MTLLTIPLVLLWVGGLVGFLFAGWTARSYVGERWLPHLASAWLFGPIALSLAFTIALNGVPDDVHQVAVRLAGGVVDFAGYALLALMLYLIARRLPAGSRQTEGDEATEGGD